MILKILPRNGKIICFLDVIQLLNVCQMENEAIMEPVTKGIKACSIRRPGADEPYPGFQVFQGCPKISPEILSTANRCLIHNKKAEPSLVEKVSITPNSGKTIKLNDSISFFSF